jgi:hypothetical protein
MQSLSDFYHTHYSATAFTLAFLSGAHLLQLQHKLTVALRYTSGTDSAPLVPFSELLVARLIDFATKFRYVTPYPQQMKITDQMFINEYIDNMSWDENYGMFWKRWCSEGIPDPNNIPLPLYGDKRDLTLELTDYSLSHPYGTERLPRY